MDQATRYVAYYRMSPADDRDGLLPLDRQKRAVSIYLQGMDHDLVGEFTEVQYAIPDDEDAPALGLALDCCRTLGAALIAAVGEPAMDRDTIERARRDGIEILLIAAPKADESVDDPSRGRADRVPYLSLRGASRPPLPQRADDRPRRPAGNREKADQFARAILPIIDQIRATGATSLTDIADALNARQIGTARGRRWYPTTVRNILNRRPDDAPD